MYGAGVWHAIYIIKILCCDIPSMYTAVHVTTLQQLTPISRHIDLDVRFVLCLKYICDWRILHVSASLTLQQKRNG